MVPIAAPDQIVNGIQFTRLGGVGLFRGAITDNMKRIDSVGIATVGSASALRYFVEGTPLVSMLSSTLQHAYVRKFPLAGPQDTNNNLNDFVVVTPTGATINGLVTTIGTPAPANRLLAYLAIPSDISLLPLDTAKGFNDSPNLVYNPTPVPNGPVGTLVFRRTLQNNTGKSITRLRLSIVDITNNPAAPVGTAILNLLNSVDVSVTTSVGVKLAKGVRLMAPATEPGRINGVWEVPLTTPLAQGQSVNVELRTGAVRIGQFRLAYRYEILAQ